MNFDFDLPPLSDPQRLVLRWLVGFIVVAFMVALAFVMGIAFSVADDGTHTRFTLIGMSLGVLAVLELSLLGLLIALFKLTSLKVEQ